VTHRTPAITRGRHEFTGGRRAAGRQRSASSPEIRPAVASAVALFVGRPAAGRASRFKAASALARASRSPAAAPAGFDRPPAKRVQGCGRRGRSGRRLREDGRRRGAGLRAGALRQKAVDRRSPCAHSPRAREPAASSPTPRARDRAARPAGRLRVRGAWPRGSKGASREDRATLPVDRQLEARWSSLRPP